jgi:monofunctional biosynthetic peptidoglycan transglycosylase
MKALRKTPLLKAGLILSLALLFLSPLYMYFAHDVSALKNEFPHVLIDGEEVNVEIKKDRPATWTRISQMSRYARWAIILSEDWAFYQHDGVDLEQMKVAFSEMLEGSRFRGASTITQQMVKNVYLSSSRSLWRKMHEIILAHKVEKALSKERILEIYFNSIEYGPGIYGIRKAALHYFGKHPAALTPREGAFLAMLLPSPKRYYISFKKKHLTNFARIRLKAILTKMRMAKIITPDQFQSELNTKFTWEQ